MQERPRCYYEIKRIYAFPAVVNSVVQSLQANCGISPVVASAHGGSGFALVIDDSIPLAKLLVSVSLVLRHN